MALKEPHLYSMVILCPNVHDLGPFRSVWKAKKVRKMAQKGSKRPLLGQYGYTLTNSTCFGAIHAFMGHKN